MTYLCPVCRQNSLTVIARMNLATEDHGANSPAQLLLCGHCGLHAVGVAGQSAEESPSSLGYIIDRWTWSELHLSWAGSPNPAEPLLTSLPPWDPDLLSDDELRAFTMVPAAGTT